MHDHELREPEISKSLRVLHVGPLPPPWSGIGVFLQNFLESAPLRSEMNWVIDTSRKVLPGDPARFKLPTPGRITRHLRIALTIFARVRKYHIQLVHLNGSSHDLSFIANWLRVLAVRLAGAKAVLHLHDDLRVVLFPGDRYWTRLMFAIVMRSADALAVLTKQDQLVACRFGPPGKVHVITPTSSPALLRVDLKRFESGDLHVLYVGWLTKAKGIFDLLQVAHDVCARNPRIVFDILGTGMAEEETNLVRTRIEEYRLVEQVRLWGVVTGEEKNTKFANAHLFFTPTYRDAFPVSVLEAMAAGLPVLGTSVGGLPSMLEDGHGAILVQPGDITEMSSALVRLAQSPELRLEMGRANRDRFVEHYHPDQVGRTAVALYEKLFDRDCAG